jgi:hypothetical protein
MKIASFTLMPDSENEVNLTSKAFPCSGYYRSYNVFNTVTIHTDKLLGRLYFEGTLAQYPEEKDWFPIIINDSEYLEYDGSEANKSEFYNINNNLTNIRVKLDRSYIENLDTTKMGRVEKIYLAF